MKIKDIYAIEERVNEIYTKISDLEKEKLGLQKKCPHPKDRLSKKHGYNTGGYDGPSFDKYWTDFNCQICGKFWTEDGSK